MPAIDFPAKPWTVGQKTSDGKLVFDGTGWVQNTFFTMVVREKSVAMSANNIDLSAGSFFTKTSTGAFTLTVSNWPAAGDVATGILSLTNGGLGAITYPNGSKFAGGTKPVLTASGRDDIGFYSIDGGSTSTWFLLGKDIK